MSFLTCVCMHTSICLHVGAPRRLMLAAVGLKSGKGDPLRNPLSMEDWLAMWGLRGESRHPPRSQGLYSRSVL